MKNKNLPLILNPICPISFNRRPTILVSYILPDFFMYIQA